MERPENVVNYRSHFTKIPRPTVISVSSGKGGVGKTLTSLCLAMNASRVGFRTLLFDADLGLSNVNFVLGRRESKTLQDVMSGNIAIEDAISGGPEGIQILSSGSGVRELQDLSLEELSSISSLLSKINKDFDVIVVDTSAGIGPGVLHFAATSHLRVIVTTPEPHAVADAYALLKTAYEAFKLKDVQLIVNMCHSEDEGVRTANRIADVTRRFLGMRADFAGSVPFDPSLSSTLIYRNVASQILRSTAGLGWANITKSLLSVAPKEAKLFSIEGMT